MGTHDKKNGVENQVSKNSTGSTYLLFEITKRGKNSMGGGGAKNLVDVE